MAGVRPRSRGWYTESPIFFERATDVSRERIEMAVREARPQFRSNNHEKVVRSIGLSLFAAGWLDGELCPAAQAAEAGTATRN